MDILTKLYGPFFDVNNWKTPIMLEIPPRVNSAFTSAFFVWATKPVSTKLANCLIVKDGGSVINYLIPWGVAGSFAASTLGVSVLAFLPFTFF